MTDYTKTTDFTSKDSLPSGDSGKIIRGAEFGTEFDNIETAVNSKSNIDNPSFTGNITVTGTVDGRDIAADGTKLDTVETSADVTDTANVTAAGAVMDSELTNIAAVKALNQGVATTDSPTFAAVTSTGNVTVGGTVDGRDVAADGTKLDGIEAGATADQTAAQIKTAYESNADTNAFTDADHTKLDGIEASADVTDATNVTAAGALMDSEVTNLAQVKAFDSADYATAAQGTTADAALPKTGGAMTGAITTNSTFDGRDVATDGTKLDGIEALADVTDTTNVTAAGALMDSELTSIASVKALNQGVATTDSPTFAALTSTGEITANGGIALGDGDELTLGDSDEFKIKHHASGYTHLQNTVGTLYIDSDSVTFRDDDGSPSNMVISQTGIDVTGSVTADGLEVEAATPVIEIDSTTSANLATLQFTTSGTVDSKITHQASTGVMTIDSGRNASWGGKIDFVTDTDTRMRIDSSGNVGIGTSSPIAPLHVKGTTNGNLYVRAGSLAVGTLTGTALSSVNDAANATVPLTLEGSEFNFVESNAVVAKIDSSGRVGIGTSPGTKLHVLSGTDNNIAANVSEVRFIGADKAITGEQANLVIQTNDDVAINKGGSIGLGGRHTTSSTDSSNFAQISGRKENATSANFAGYLAFGTSDSASDIHERMRIDSSGNVGIGNAVASSMNAGANQLVVGSGSTGQGITLYSSTSTAGSIHFADGTSGSEAYRGQLVYNHNGDYMAMLTAATERMRIDSSGQVGIGTSSPLSKLNVKGTQGNWRVDPDSVSGEIQVLATTTANDGFRNFRLRSNESIFETGGTERMRIDASGNVGINTSSPSAKFGINASAPDFTMLQSDVVKFRSGVSGTTNGGVTGSASGDYFARTSGGKMLFSTNDGVTAHAVIDASGKVGIGTSSPLSILHVGSGGDANLPITFAPASGGNVELRSTTSTGSFTFTNANGSSEKMRIDVSGNLLVGTTTAAVANGTTAGIAATSGDQLLIGTSSDVSAAFNRITNDGDIVLFRKDGTTVGSIGTSGGLLVIGDSDCGIAFEDGSTNHIYPWNVSGGAANNDAISLGANGAAFKDLYLSGGINLGGPSEINASIAYLRSSSTNTSSLTLRKAISSADAVDYVQCRNDANTLKLVIEGSGDIKNTNNSYGAISDEKLKENIVDATSQWDDIKAVRVRKYSLKEDGLDAPNMLGVVAQELESAGMNGLVSESVDRNEDNANLGTVTKSVNYSILYMKAVKALQEAMVRIESLEAEVSALKGD